MAAVVYVVAWLAGLVVAPAAPGAFASAAEVSAFYTDAPASVFVQSWLVHGIAGVALLTVVVSVARALSQRAGRGAGRAAMAAGSSAAVVSFVQVVVLHVLALGGGGVAPATAEAWFDGLNRADSVKLVLLAAFAAVVSVAAGRRQLLPRWLVALGLLLAALLPLGASAFWVDVALLYYALVASLVALLAWVGGLGAALSGRRVTPAAGIPRQR